MDFISFRQLNSSRTLYSRSISCIPLIYPMGDRKHTKRTVSRARENGTTFFDPTGPELCVPKIK